MVSPSYTRKPAPPPPDAGLETPLQDGFKNMILTLERHIGTSLPHNERESPNKRKKSPGHDIVNYANFLHYNHNDCLSQALESFTLQTPLSRNPDDKLNCMREILLETVTKLVKKATPESTPHQSLPLGKAPAHEENLLSGLPSPTRSIKHAPLVDIDTLRSPLMPVNLGAEDNMPQSSTRRPPIGSSGMSQPVFKPSQELANALQQPAPNNVSFETAQTSFWSAPAGSQMSQGSATTVASSMGGMDGACDVDNGIDVDTTQSTDYGRFSLPPDSTISGAVQPGIAADYYLIPGDETQPSTPIHEEDMETYRSDGGHVIAPTRYKGPMSSMDEQQYLDLAAAAAKAKNDSTLADHNEMETPPKRPRSPDAGFGYARPAKQKVPENWRAIQLIEEGLPHVELPLSMEGLPFGVCWEAARVLQKQKITPEDLERSWKLPRTIASLQALADQATINIELCPEADLPECSYTARLTMSFTKDGLRLALELLQPSKQLRNEFERELGVDRILVLEYSPPTSLIGISKDELRNTIIKIMGNEHRLIGRKWRQFWTREKKRKRKTDIPGTREFYFFACSGLNLKPVTSAEFLDKQLCFRENAHQPSGKLYSRLEMKASRTLEGPRFRVDQIQWIDDLKATKANEDTGFRDPTLTFNDEYDSETVMTDGCGTISPYAMRMSMEACGYNGPMPSALQARIAGCKGMFVLQNDETLYNPDAPPPDKLITITKSQVKIKQKLGQEYFTLYILQFSGPPKPSILHPGFLPILYDRHVPKDVICDFSVASIHAVADEFEAAAADPIDLRRWFHEQEDRSKATNRHLGIKMIGGLPDYPTEKISRMLECGFKPAENRSLKIEVLEQVVKMLSGKAKTYKISCVNSTTLLGVPDFTGTLKPGEVHIKLSKGWDGFNSSTLGQVFRELVLARNPARRPGDMQRLRLVQKEELSFVVDVVVFSTQGCQPEASKLQGGDYDGDSFWACWEPSIVKEFLNAPASREADRRPANELFLTEDKRAFRDIVTVSEDMGLPIDDAELCKWLNINTEKRMQENLLGVMTRLHERVAYHTGKLSSPVLDALNDLDDYLLDAYKQCLSFSWDASNKLKAKLEITSDYDDDPAYMKFTTITVNEGTMRSKRYSEPRNDSIVDQVYCVKLQSAAEAAQARVKCMFPKANLHDQDVTTAFDERLAQLSRGFLGTGARKELEALPERMLKIAEMYKRLMEECNTSKDKSLIVSARRRVRQAFMDVQPEETGNELVKEWLRPMFNDDVSTWEYFKAVVLFKKCDYTELAKVPFNVAGKELCRMKAQAVSKRDKIPAQISTGVAYYRTKPIKVPASRVSRIQNVRHEDDGIEATDADEVVGDEGEEAGVDDELLGEDWETVDVGIGGASTPPYRRESEALIDLTGSD